MYISNTTVFTTGDIRMLGNSGEWNAGRACESHSRCSCGMIRPWTQAPAVETRQFHVLRQTRDHGMLKLSSDNARSRSIATCGTQAERGKRAAPMKMMPLSSAI